MHKSYTFWQGLRDGSRSDGDIPRVAALLQDTCCTEAYLIGRALGLHYAHNKIRLKTKVFWLAPLGAALWLILDKIGHLFGICIGG